MSETDNNRQDAIQAALKIDRVKKLNLDPLVEYFENLLSARERFIRDHPGKGGRGILTEDAARKRLADGKSLWDDPVRMVEDLSLSIDAFRELIRVSPGSDNTELDEKLSRIAGTIVKDDRTLTELLDAVLRSDEEDIAAHTSLHLLDEDLVLFLSRHAFRAVRESVRRKADDLLDPELWLRGRCPFCGSYPHMSVLKEEEGYRFLSCDTCGGAWESKRVFCPFCGNDDHETLKYLYVEEEPEYRIDICNKCKNYIKTVDQRKAARPVDPEIEDLISIFLDIIAHQEHYDRVTALPVPGLFDAEGEN
jgi:FdhE protein